MKRRTTTKQLNTAISNNLLQIIKAERYNKTSRRTDVIDADTFKESLEFLGETLFADCVGWHYERDYKTGQYIIEVGRMDGDSDYIIVHLCASDDVNVEDIDKTLSVAEDE